MVKKIIGVIDEPISQSSLDYLDISIHSESLIRFIKETNTPITIGIQGEWGSGKTSLINSIHHSLNEQPQYKQIWINSWEYSLLSNPEESLMKIVSKIIHELLSSDQKVSQAEKVGEAAKTVFKSALRIGASVVGGSSSAEVAKDLFEETDKNISELRNQLRELVEDIKKRDSNPYEKVIIYVDDLDRIEPRNAVAILELLKNIFNVPNCVFILAIDYQVVVKGLEHKFGKQTSDNEWEFRAFFDKIIQLPFMMPMGQYNIGKYVNNLLLDIGFVDGEGLDTNAIREIILRTIGGNPRAIKRLVNSVSLIEIFTDTKNQINGDENDKADEVTVEQKRFLLFSLLCLQIAYPYIYTLLTEKPNFTEWDNDFAHSQTMKKEMIKENYPQFESEFDNAKSTDDFDESWEQALFRICYVKPRIKNRVVDISRFFSYIKDELLNGDVDLIGELILETLDKTSVTSVTSTDSQQVVIPEKIHGQRRILDNFDTFIKKEMLESKVKNIGSVLEEIKFLHDSVNSKFDNISWQYSGAVSGSVNGHKFITIYPRAPKSKMHLLRHKDNNYKIPKIKSLETTTFKKYSKGVPTSANGSEKYSIRFGLGEAEKNKEVIFDLIKLSYEMAELYWNEKLSINLKSQPHNISGKGFDEKDNINVEKVAEEYLSNDYTYSVDK